MVSDGKGVTRLLEAFSGAEGWVLGLGRYLRRALYCGPARLDGTVYSSRSGTSEHGFHAQEFNIPNVFGRCRTSERRFI